METKTIRLVPLNQIPLEFLREVEAHPLQAQWFFVDGKRTIRAKSIRETGGKTVIEFFLEIEFVVDDEEAS